MRSALVSPVPIIIVAVDSTPRLCATSMISHQRSPDSFNGANAFRGRSGRSSAPAPAIESSPAALIRRIASSMETPETCDMWPISDGPIEWIANCGNSRFTVPNSSS